MISHILALILIVQFIIGQILIIGYGLQNNCYMVSN